MATKTVGFIVNRATELAQLDSSFLPLARQYYNVVIYDLSTDFDFPFYRIEAANVSLVAGTTAYALPADYSRSDTCYFIDSNNNRRMIPIISKYKFDRMRNGGSVDGDARMAYIDLANQEIVFDHVQSGSYQLTYFKQADAVSYTHLTLPTIYSV